MRPAVAFWFLHNNVDILLFRLISCHEPTSYSKGLVPTDAIGHGVVISSLVDNTFRKFALGVLSASASTLQASSFWRSDELLDD